jgi:hypothetical protein
MDQNSRISKCTEHLPSTIDSNRCSICDEQIESPSLKTMVPICVNDALIHAIKNSPISQTAVDPDLAGETIWSTDGNSADARIGPAVEIGNQISMEVRPEPCAEALDVILTVAPVNEDHSSKSIPKTVFEDVPGYEVLSTLGRRGMGVVYRARQIRANRVVALKMIIGGSHARAV